MRRHLRGISIYCITYGTLVVMQWNPIDLLLNCSYWVCMAGVGVSTQRTSHFTFGH